MARCAVWPWLAQMGPSPRGGAYTYDWIENMLGLNMHSADGVLPEDFFSTTNLPTYVRVGGEWRMPREPRMDSALVLDALFEERVDVDEVGDRGDERRHGGGGGCAPLRAPRGCGSCARQTPCAAAASPTGACSAARTSRAAGR